jgi:hypothetical protein
MKKIYSILLLAQMGVFAQAPVLVENFDYAAGTAWIPFVGSILGCLLVVLVAATDFPGNPAIAYASIAALTLSCST